MEVVSRTIAGLEALVILLPLTAVSFYPFAAPVALIVGMPALICGWVLIIRFIRSGREGLADLSLLWWVIPALTGVATTAGLGALLMNLPHGPVRDVVGLFGLGWPALIPLLHLAVERILASRIE